MGRIEEVTARLLKETITQLVVLTGHNERLRVRCERLAQRDAVSQRLRVLGWVGPDEMPRLMWAADLMVSKLGSMFNEAIAAELPIIALEPQPGAERVQYRLLEEWKVGRAVHMLDEVAAEVKRLLSQPHEIQAMREAARAHRTTDVSGRIARWLVEAINRKPLDGLLQQEHKGRRTSAAIFSQ
jgi:UDP-N-acetylglucosamine:LPS N-acetylglucosamine transferase